jgi:hypothetical protein
LAAGIGWKEFQQLGYEGNNFDSCDKRKKQLDSWDKRGRNLRSGMG